MAKSEAEKLKQQREQEILRKAELDAQEKAEEVRKLAEVNESVGLKKLPPKARRRRLPCDDEPTC